MSHSSNPTPSSRTEDKWTLNLCSTREGSAKSPGLKLVTKDSASAVWKRARMRPRRSKSKTRDEEILTTKMKSWLKPTCSQFVDRPPSKTRCENGKQVSKGVTLRVGRTSMTNQIYE